MSIFIAGTLTINTRTGRYGNFNIGKLITSIGEFVVKDKELDQYEAGKYQGQFEIEKIKSAHYTYGNCLIVECRAYLASMSLYDITSLTKEEQDVNAKEQDPLEEERTNQQATQPNIIGLNHNGCGDLQVAVNPANTNSDTQLFGLLWPLGNSVKLDSTCDRETLRKQSERLNQLGYVFSYKTQLWNLH